MKTPIDFDKGRLLKNKNVRDLKENLLVGDVVSYFKRENSKAYRFGVVKSFSKRGNTELVVISEIRSDFTTVDISIELSEYNFIVGLDMDIIYNFRVEQIEKDVDELKKELKCVKYKLLSVMTMSIIVI